MGATNWSRLGQSRDLFRVIDMSAIHLHLISFLTRRFGIKWYRKVFTVQTIVCEGHRRKSAFTLTEMIVVVGIILILLALLFPTFRGMFAGAMRARCASNLRQIGAGWAAYITENKGQLPVPHDDYRMLYNWDGTPAGIGMVIEAGYLPEPNPRYTMEPKDRGIYVCPALTPMSNYTPGGNSITYAVDPRNGRYRSDIGGPGVNHVFWIKSWDVQATKRAQIVCSDPSAHQSCPNVLYLDGHVQSLNKETTIEAFEGIWSFDKLDLPSSTEE